MEEEHTMEEEYTMEEYAEFLVNDPIVARLKLPDPCNISVRVSDSYISLCVGQRDWQWDRESGELTDTGTYLTSADDYTPSKEWQERNTPESMDKRSWA